ATDVTPLVDGRVLAAGTRVGGVVLARLLNNGAPDPSFGSAGRSETVVGPGGFSGMGDASLFVQPNGLLAGSGPAPGIGGGDFVVAMYNPDGSPDTRFGAGGFVTTDFAGGADGASALLFQPDGKCVAAGTATVGKFRQFALARYEADTAAPAPADDDLR